MALRVLPAAKADIEAAARYIAEHNPDAARRWLDDLARRLTLLARTPALGVARPDIRAGLRMLAAGRYLILYRAAEPDVDIVRVLHGARQWQDLL